MKCFACEYEDEPDEFLEFVQSFNLKDLKKYSSNIHFFACPNCGNLVIDKSVIEYLKIKHT
ncbi:MAG: hypothetical protein ACFFDF_22685 [Candidatus Odinarchaeota archaeon]